MSTILMCKDIPVLEIRPDSSSIIHNYDLLPINIRKRDANVEDFYSEWINNRAISISRTNAKAILNSLRLSQTNTSAICRACHAVTLLDSYWIKDSGEDLSWKDVNLFENSLTKSLAITALTGRSSMKENGKIHTPELTTQGMSAKSWWREGNEIYLYKVGKKELAASKILDLLGVDHVKYEEIIPDRLEEIVTEERKLFLEEMSEKIVKCKLLSNEKTAIVSFEEFAIFCEYEGKNPFEEVIKKDARHYYQMQIADYIISNEDRHIGNWGFYMDSDTGTLMGLHPLFDHDHAFSLNTHIMSQTTENDESLLFSAMKAQEYLKLDLETVKNSQKPEEISQNQWERVLGNIDMLISQCRFKRQLEKNHFIMTEKVVEEYEKLCQISGKPLSLSEICNIFKSKEDNDLVRIVKQIGNELKKQEIVANQIVKEVPVR